MFDKLRARYTPLQWMLIFWAIGSTMFSVMIIALTIAFTTWKVFHKDVMEPWQNEALLKPHDIGTLAGRDVGEPEVRCQVNNDTVDFLVTCRFALSEGLFVASRIERSNLISAFENQWMRLYVKSKLLPAFDHELVYTTDVAYIIKSAKPEFIFGDETLMWRAQTLEQEDLGMMLAYRIGNYTYSITIHGKGSSDFAGWEHVLGKKLALVKRELD